MSNSDELDLQDGGWRFHAPILSDRFAGDDRRGNSASRSEFASGSESSSDSGSSSDRKTSRGGGPRYSRSLARRIKGLKDGDVARFQVGDSCFMALKIGSELFVRPFGEDSEIRVNGIPVTGMTRITCDDCLQIGKRSILLRPPRQPEARRDYNVEKLLEIPDEPPKNAAAERDRQTRVGYRDPTRPPEAWGE